MRNLSEATSPTRLACKAEGPVSVRRRQACQTKPLQTMLLQAKRDEEESLQKTQGAKLAGLINLSLLQRKPSRRGDIVESIHYLEILSMAQQQQQSLLKMSSSHLP